MSQITSHKTESGLLYSRYDDGKKVIINVGGSGMDIARKNEKALVRLLDHAHQLGRRSVQDQIKQALDIDRNMYDAIDNLREEDV